MAAHPTQLSISFIKIEIREFTYHEFHENDFDREAINFRIENSLRYDTNGETYGNVFYVDQAVALVVNDNFSDPLARLTVTSTFRIQSGDNPTIDLQDWQVPRDLMETLVSLTISTVRGILFEKLAGTKLDGLVMPLVSNDTWAPPATVE